MLLESSLDIVPPGGRAHAGTIEKRKVLETHSPAYK